MERPAESADLSAAEKAALDYADRFTRNHLSIDDRIYDGLRRHFSEAQIVELGMTVGFFVGFGRLAATLHMVDELPSQFRVEGTEEIAPWKADHIVLR